MLAMAHLTATSEWRPDVQYLRLAAPDPDGAPPKKKQTSGHVLNAYCGASGLFFSACAFVQLNDPDPLLWALAYLVGGALFNVLVVTCRGTATATELVSPAAKAFAGVNAVVTAYLIFRLIPRIDFALPWRDLVWSVLEFEEGREIAGLVLLQLHVGRLSGYLRDESPSSLDTRGKRGLIGTLLLAGVLGGAAYLWVYYQPEMNARYKTMHCAGAFGGGDGAHKEL